jgi:tetraacyldisaccharide 4'-kinase
VGDEPLLLYKKHTSASVAVCKNRIEGLNKIYEKLPETDVVLLDDAYQYMPLKPGLSILLTDYYHSYMQDFIFPVGKLREGRSATKDADIIIITKSPKTIPTIEEKMIMNKVSPLPHQKVYFSSIEFGALLPFTQKAKEMQHNNIQSVVAVCGIANPYPFLEYIKDNYAEKQQLVFSDHHRFTEKDIQKIYSCWDRSMRRNCAVVTTEKDAVRLLDSELRKEVEKLPVFYIPIEVKFHQKYQEEFEKQIQEYVSKNKKYS